MRLKTIFLLLLFVNTTFLFGQGSDDCRVSVFKENGKYGLEDCNRKIIFSAQFDTIDMYDFSNYGVCKKGNEYKIISWKGKDITPFRFSRYRLNRCCGGEPIALDDKWGVMDPDNGKVIVPFIYDSIDPGDGIGQMFIKGKVGVYNYMSDYYEKGVIIPAEYDSLDSSYTRTLHTIVYNGNKEGLYADVGLAYNKGALLLEAVYDSIVFQELCKHCGDDLVIARKENYCKFYISLSEKFEFIGNVRVEPSIKIIGFSLADDLYILFEKQGEVGLYNFRKNNIKWGFRSETEAEAFAQKESKKYMLALSKKR